MVQRIRRAATVLSIMVTWSLENAIETADSMKSRGYGLPGRTAFSIYRMDSRDKIALAWLGFCGLFLLTGALAGGLSWRYYPTMRGADGTPLTVLWEICYLAVCLTPAAMDRWEDRKWRRLTAGEDVS